MKYAKRGLSSVMLVQMVVPTRAKVVVSFDDALCRETKLEAKLSWARL